MFNTLRNAWRIPELRKKILFTLLILLIYQIGDAIPVPFVNGAVMYEYFSENLSNIILTADVTAANETGFYGNSYRVNSAVNQTLSMTVSSGANMRFAVTVSNSKHGYTASAEQVVGAVDISERIAVTDDGFILTLPENTSGQDQNYRVTVRSIENENITVVIEVTVLSKPVSEMPTEPTEPSTEPTEPPTAATEPATVPTEPAA